MIFYYEWCYSRCEQVLRYYVYTLGIHAVNTYPAGIVR
jgi:hypothetical protein